MTEALTVILEAPIGDEDAARLIAAISLLCGVLRVEPFKPAFFTQQIADARARAEIERRLWAALQGPAE